MEYESILFKTSIFIDPENGFINIKKCKAHKTKGGYVSPLLLHKRISFSDLNVIKNDVIRDTFTSISRYAFTESEEAAKSIALEMMKELSKFTSEVSKNMEIMSQRLSKEVDVNDLSVEDMTKELDYSRFKFTEDML